MPASVRAFFAHSPTRCSLLEQDIGANNGKYYSINFPLLDGVDDWSYENIFKPVLQKVMEHYRPSAVVMQCGADSLSGDRLGCFNLSIKGTLRCIALRSLALACSSTHLILALGVVDF